jgi:hypothetical protein
VGKNQLYYGDNIEVLRKYISAVAYTNRPHTVTTP